MLDCSNIWDSETYEHDDWHVMSVAFETRLRDRLTEGDDFFSIALEEIARHGHALYLWRILIRNAGATDASALAVAGFVCQRTVLLTHELGEPIAAYLGAAYVRLPLDARRAIDAAILSLVDEEEDDELRGYRDERAREYAASISRDEIVTERLARMVRTIEETTPDDALYRRKMTLSGSYDHGFTVTRPRIKEGAEAIGASSLLVAAIDDAQSIFDAASNVQTERNAAGVAPRLRRIDELSRGAEGPIRAQALDIFAALVCIGLGWDAFDAEERAEFLPLVLEAVAVEEVLQDGELREASDRADGHISWGSPNAVADGIQALWRLYRHEHDDRIVAAIQRLTRHPRSNMRYLAVREAGLFRDTDSEVVWTIAERAAADSAIGVVSAGIQAANMVAHLDFERLRRIMFSVYDRFVVANPKNDCARGVLQWVIARALMEDSEAADRLERVLAEPWAHADIAESVIVDLAHRLAPAAPLDYRASSSQVLVTLVERLLGHMEALTLRHGFEIGAYPEPQKTEAVASIRLLGEAAERVYYVSGVMQRVQVNGPFRDTGVIDAEQLRLLRPILQPLARFAFSRSSYYVVKTLQGAIDTDPRQVLLLGWKYGTSLLRSWSLNSNWTSFLVSLHCTAIS